jgi:molybdopterin-guanine dinucleotide biosynthesis protein A
MAAASGIRTEAVTGVVLAGGQARRMGGTDKGLYRLADRPMVEYVLDALRPQVGTLLINANRNFEQYGRYGVPVVADDWTGFQGPLAGIAAALRAAPAGLIATAPCDSPFVPADLVRRLAAAMSERGADISVAHSGDRLQPVFSLLRTGLLDSLLDFLQRGERKIDRWFAEQRTVTADFSDVPAAFLNINTPEDAREIESRLREPAHDAR